MNYTILITAPPFDSPGTYTAYQFCQAVFDQGHRVAQIFFYGAGVYNANRLLSPPVDEINLMTLWQELAKQHAVKLHVCVAAAQHRGILDKQEAEQQHLSANLAETFNMTGLGQLIEAANDADRFITFN